MVDKTGPLHTATTTDQHNLPIHKFPCFQFKTLTILESRWLLCNLSPQVMIATNWNILTNFHLNETRISYIHGYFMAKKPVYGKHCKGFSFRQTSIWIFMTSFFQYIITCTQLKELVPTSKYHQSRKMIPSFHQNQSRK